MRSQAFRHLVLGLVFGASLLVLESSVVLADPSSESNARPVMQAEGPWARAGAAATGPSCRYGVAALSPQQYTWLNPLSAGWYVNFSSQDGAAQTAEYVPVVRIRQNKQGCTYLPGYTTSPALNAGGLGAAVLGRPGALWIVGNEPDRGPSPGAGCSQGAQDDTQPDVYAQAYHDVYQFIKRNDPTARVANAGLVEVTPGRLQYLDKVWAAYQQKYGQPWPVDVWNIHLYILPEVDTSGKPNGIASVAVGTDPVLAIRESGGCGASDTACWRAQCARSDVYCYAEHDDMNEFANQIVAMRKWMKTHGQQEKALIVSEYSLLYPYEVDPGGCFLSDEFGKCFTPTRVRDFMSHSLDYLETAFDPNLGYPGDGYRLAQRWLWFSVQTYGAGAASNLTDDAAANLTVPGQNFQARAAAAPRTLNLYPARTSGVALGSPGDAGPLNATLIATINNSGSAATTGKVTVAFYADAALTQSIASAEVVTPIDGCDGRGAQVSVSWPGQTQGKRDYWVVVDPDKLWGETNEADNVLKGTLFVGSTWTFLPTIFR